MSSAPTVNRPPDYLGAERFILSKLFRELSPKLTYHNAAHTQSVLEAALVIAAAEQIQEEEVRLLRIAVCFHDAGFLFVYARHEEKGCELARQYLPAFGLSQDEISQICGMILATRFPQKPSSRLEQVIADADLDYLGREEVNEVARTLYEELKTYGKIKSKKEWNHYQLRILGDHFYHTAYSRALREPRKQQYLDQLRFAG
ncbi:MAG TPA: HD domain-containing protein [Chitinophagaceae bacterium]|nr:HD domain-containing protein [Chitinophagaceae bacterium]